MSHWFTRRVLMVQFQRLFANKFWSHLTCYHITHDIPDMILSSKVFIFSIWTQQTFACSKSIIREKFEICSQLTIQRLERCYWHRSSGFILNLEQISHLILVLQLLTLNRQFLVGANDITNKAYQNKIFSSI